MRDEIYPQPQTSIDDHDEWQAASRGEKLSEEVAFRIAANKEASRLVMSRCVKKIMSNAMKSLMGDPPPPADDSSEVSES